MQIPGLLNSTLTKFKDFWQSTWKERMKLSSNLLKSSQGIILTYLSPPESMTWCIHGPIALSFSHFSDSLSLYQTTPSPILILKELDSGIPVLTLSVKTFTQPKRLTGKPEVKCRQSLFTFLSTRSILLPEMDIGKMSKPDSGKELDMLKE